MYKRYLEPDHIPGESLPTKYILKKLKPNVNIHSCGNGEVNDVENVSDIQYSTDDKERSEVDSIASDNNYRCDDPENESQSTAEENLDVIDDDNFFDFVTDELIHPNLECKQSDAVLMILSFFLEHQLTWVALEALLTLFHCVLGKDSSLPKTKYLFKKCFGLKDRAVFHFFCKNCDLYLGTYEDINDLPDEECIENDHAKQKYKLKKCMNCENKYSLQRMNDGSFFIQLPLKPQIEEKLKNDPDILNFNTDPNPKKHIADIFDGELYKSLKATCGKFKLLTLTLNTDGVRVHKSKAKSSLWPIQMILNEVPLGKRYKQSNIILSGISFGKEPDFNVYMRPLVEELKNIDQDKIKVSVNNTEQEIALRVLLVSADSPARCKVLKMKQYNGKYGCTYCLHPGETIGESKVSKYSKLKGSYQLRTHEDTVKLMKEFLQTGEGNFGIMGVSPLLGLPDYQLIRGSIIDYMHAVLLGVVYFLLELWFDSENHFEDYYVTPRGTEYINKNIKCIRPPRSFTRQARPVDEKQFWKANELRNWLLYYAIPCLRNTLKDKYFRHFSLLSEAIFILLKAEISNIDFTTASNNLTEFTTQFELYYGTENMVYNVHLLEHLPKCVKDCGPLWAYSNFNFESSNGFLVKNVKGTTDVELQLAEKYFLNNELTRKKKNVSENALAYIDRKLNKKVKKFKKVNDVTLFGNQRKHHLNDQEKTVLQQTKCSSYNKFHYKNEMYFSSKFKRSKKRVDTTVLLKNGTFAEISLVYESNGTVCLLLRKLPTQLVQGVPRHLRKVSTEFDDEYFIANAEDISEKCILIETLNELYVSPFPNRFESD